MKVKTFTGESLTEALIKAKQEFGNDIILLESREIKPIKNKSIKKLVQISVSVDDRKKTVKAWSPPVIQRQDKSVQPVEAPEIKKSGSDDFSSKISEILERKPKELNQEKKILDELASLREQLNMIKVQSGQPKAEESFPQAYQKVLDDMSDKGVSETIAETLIKKAYQFSPAGSNAGEKEIINNVKNEMRQMFSAYDLADKSGTASKKTILLVGATGVGKTTSAMKLASHPDIFGKKDVAIISADPYGPSEALRAFSKMNGTPIYEKKRADELENVLKKTSRNDVVLVDMPGQSPFAPNYLNNLEEYIKAVKPTDIFLVLAMNADLKDLFLASALYLLVKPTGIILTKFDETSQPGKVFPIIDELKLPVVALCEGTRIFIDIELANVEFVWDKIFETV